MFTQMKVIFTSYEADANETADLLGNQSRGSQLLPRFMYFIVSTFQVHKHREPSSLLTIGFFPTSTVSPRIIQSFDHRLLPDIDSITTPPFQTAASTHEIFIPTGHHPPSHLPKREEPSDRHFLEPPSGLARKLGKPCRAINTWHTSYKPNCSAIPKRGACLPFVSNTRS